VKENSVDSDKVVHETCVKSRDSSKESNKLGAPTVQLDAHRDKKNVVKLKLPKIMLPKFNGEFISLEVSGIDMRVLYIIKPVNIRHQ